MKRILSVLLALLLGLALFAPAFAAEETDDSEIAQDYVFSWRDVLLVVLSPVMLVGSLLLIPIAGMFLGPWSMMLPAIAIVFPLMSLMKLWNYFFG